MQIVDSTHTKVLLRSIRHHIGAALFDAVFPNTCMVCGDFYPVKRYPVKRLPDDGCRDNDPPDGYPVRGIGQWMAPFICPACSDDFLPVRSPICVQCGIMFGTMDDEDHLCGDCMRDPKHYRIARAVGVYDRTCMELIHAFKYRRKIQLAKPFGMLLFAAFIRHWSHADIDLIIPVPLHRKRFRKRGFNQTYLIIRALPALVDSAIAGGAGVPPVQILQDCLIRNRLTDPQIGLKRDQRISNVKDVFAVSDPSTIAGKGILLVDDVYTTGATVDACTRVLLKNGATCVDVLTLARAM